jgi:16S rRNA (cytosine1407-C5)-methyltransferase
VFTAFERYAGLTDLVALNDFSNRPLRKSMRVNTLKSSVEFFKTWAEEKKWILEPVPWCPDAFYIDRIDREEALGKDLLHLLGHTYMQEAASMLPVELLQPEPGESILDMSAAPGSKTTQVGAKMKGLGVIVANDVQEKRLWTLKSSLHRCGVHNNIVTKKVGQWFAKHMTERFDRVLCDAPCSAQGTIRKDSDALDYCSMDNIEKMARLQYQLLESAIHCTKVGGRIVYSTCTLTPEENEHVVLQMLERFPEQLEVVDPRELNMAPDGYWDKAIADSILVQKEMLKSDAALPLLRLWPQTYDTEGFFCAVLRKKAPTRDVEKMELVPFQERLISQKNTKELLSQFQNRFGTTFTNENDRLFERGGEALQITTLDVLAFDMPVENYALGIPFGKKLKDGRVLIDHELAVLRGQWATENVYKLNEEQVKELLEAKDCDCSPDLRGHTLLLYRGFGVGIGLAKDGRMKNNLPRWMVRFG